MDNTENAQLGAKMSGLEKKLDRILDNQTDQGKSIVRIEAYQSVYKEQLVRVSTDADELDSRLDVLNAKINKSIGALTAITFILPFAIRYFTIK
jgi:septal ring factor EnvC (AmiA/AmiB activator)